MKSQTNHNRRKRHYLKLGQHIGGYVGWHSAETSADMLQLTIGGVSVDCLWYQCIVHCCFAETAAISLPTGTAKHPEISIERTKRPQNPHKKKSNLATQNGHILRSLTSLNDSITGSLTFSEKKPSHYALPTHPTRSEKPHLTPPRSANLLETNAPSLTPN